MKSLVIFTFLAMAFNALLVQSKVTFKVIAVSGTPSVVINKKKYTMKVEEYPVYSVTVDVNAPVNYHYALGSEEESFTRTLSSGTTTLNEFFKRKVTVKKHPLLPKAYDTFSTLKQSKLFDDTHVATILIEANQSQITSLHKNVRSTTKVDAKIYYVSPYNVKVFPNAKIALSGQSTIYNKKLSYKISDLKTSDDKELYGRSTLKLRAEYVDPSFMREKTYLDMLNAVGAPTAQGKFARVFINKSPIGLFLLTDDFDNKHFLKSTFNNGEKYATANAIFKADADGDHLGDLKYHGSSSSYYDIYSYKGDLENVNKSKMVNDILVPFLQDISKYPSTKKLNMDTYAFLRSMAVEFLGYAPDNFWQTPGNFYLFKDNSKNKWFFIDSDFDMTFGHGNPQFIVSSSLNNFLDKKSNKSRPLLDNLRKDSSHNKYLNNVIQRMLQTCFNINAAGPRIDSFAELIKEDALWDFKLSRVNTYTGHSITTYNYSESDFTREISNTSKATYPYPIKKWIIDRSKNVASQHKISVPSTPKTDLGYFIPEYETVSDHVTTSSPVVNAPTTKVTTTKVITMTTTKASLPTSTDQCGSGVAVCASNLCCSKYGWCGKTKDHCSTGCQKAFGQCW
ncbi:hypothetical protein BCR36DRAFT_416399 [Piromyces finnis]|uniref:Chitin-binding type-1 domain-containing protein n=1 Tax=Piromyces finnis TaxID=1754191 RepID=A0A1Y1UVD6_9FUNG|nr:hypothetical protein BCR36DRAFT_416399 [Piromyces finnis]|eukprot:ORX41995.1 hypothetical protein BCR36DRAFT_416399 [Piromyces finnis]